MAFPVTHPALALWLRMNINRDRNGDPRWLVPLICRRGHVTKREIGAIRIFDCETKFEIARPALGRFAAALRRSAHEDGNIRIEPSAGVGGKGKRGDARAAARAPQPHRSKRRER